MTQPTNIKDFIDDNKLLAYVNVMFNNDNNSYYDEIVDYNVSNSHPSIPVGKAVLSYFGYSKMDGIDDGRSRVIDLEDFISNVCINCA